MAGSYYNGHLVDEDEADALAVGELYGVEGVLAAEISAGDGASSPPVVTIISPTPGTQIGATTQLVFTVVDPDGLGLERAMVQTGGEGDPWEQVIREGAACPGYSLVRTAITDGFRYEITRAAGWRPGFVRLEPIYGDPTATGSINT